jgi:hypothetical protein
VSVLADSLSRRTSVLAGRRLPIAVVAATVATIAAGLIIHHTGAVRLGTKLPPFWMHWSPRLRRTVVVGVAVAAVLVAAAPWAIDRVRSGVVFAALAYGATLALGLSVNAARIGTAGWSHVFYRGPGGSYEAYHEYLPALRTLNGHLAFYVGHYAQLLDKLPTHAKGNPPGPVVIMYLLRLTTAGRLTIACVAVGALCAPLAYLLGRELGGDGAVSGERRGRVAAALTMFSPAVVLFGVTSADYAFSGMGVLGAWLLVARRPAMRAAGSVVVAVASFFSWLLLAIPVWAVLCVLRRDGLRPAVRIAVAALGAIVAFTLILALVWGYDPIAIVRALGPMYAHGEATKRPYAFWVVGSPAAWLAMMGAPIVWATARALGRREASAIAVAAIIGVSAVAGFTKAETERIWLPFVPLACVAAASVPISRLRLILGVLALQAILIEVLFGTVW